VTLFTLSRSTVSSLLPDCLVDDLVQTEPPVDKREEDQEEEASEEVSLVSNSDES